uniref:protein-serine/threonine phosphatase n=1 Tax=Anthurium amnicola TaxID=1678845 RepID=A0A1D1ZC62_9ARAE
MGSCLSSDGQRGSPTSAEAAASGASRKQRRGVKKRQGGRNSFDSKRDEQLHRIPGRMFLNGASSMASLFTQQGKKGINQDAMIVWENFGSRMDTIFCGVFDGHGPFGHMVARRVRDYLPLKLSTHWEVNVGCDDVSDKNGSTMGSMNSVESASVFIEEEARNIMDSEEKGKQPEIYMTLKELFLKAFKLMDKELRVHQSIDCFCSGTTAVTLVKQGQDLIIGNVGDSRAILGTRDKDNDLVAVQLTVDLKPDLPREAERIRQCRGRVFALQDEPEVARVWLPNIDSPGLAMARALGDFCLKDFGLISVPEISYRRLTEQDEFVVLATDGVWDVLSNKEVVDIVASVPKRSSAARSLVESAVRAWRLKYPTSKIDDCAVVCLFLNSDPSNEASIGTKTNEVDGPAHMPETASEHQEPCSPAALKRSGTVRSSCETFPEEKETTNKVAGSQLQTSVGGNVEGEVEDWSALEGVSRVNTLLTLPRFVSGDRLPADTVKK